MKEKIDAVFNILQQLELKPTPNNTSIMCGVYNTLREVYQKLEEMEAKSECSTSKDT